MSDVFFIFLCAVIAALAVSLWVAAWLYWLFSGDIRQFLFAYILPARWRSTYSPRDIMLTGSDGFDVFLATTTAIPLFIRGLFSCPGCMSAHLSSVGTLPALTLLWLGFGPSALLVAPFVWAGGAWVGHRLHSRF